MFHFIREIDADFIIALFDGHPVAFVPPGGEFCRSWDPNAAGLEKCQRVGVKLFHIGDVGIGGEAQVEAKNAAGAEGGLEILFQQMLGLLELQGFVAPHAQMGVVIDGGKLQPVGFEAADPGLVRNADPAHEARSVPAGSALAVGGAQFVVQIAHDVAGAVMKLADADLVLAQLMQHDLLAGNEFVAGGFVRSEQQADVMPCAGKLLNLFLEVGVIQVVIDVFVLFRGYVEYAAEPGILLQLAVFREIPVEFHIGEEKAEFAADAVQKLAPTEGKKHREVAAHGEEQFRVVPFLQVVNAVRKQGRAFLGLWPVLLLNNVDALGAGVFLDHAVDQPEQVVHVGRVAMGIELAGLIRKAAIRIAGGIDLRFQAGQMEEKVSNEVEIDLSGVDFAFRIVFSGIGKAAGTDHRGLREQLDGFQAAAEFFRIHVFGIEEVGLALDEDGDEMARYPLQFFHRGIGVTVDEEDVVVLQLARVRNEAISVSQGLKYEAEGVLYLVLIPRQLVIYEDRDHAQLTANFFLKPEIPFFTMCQAKSSVATFFA